MPGADISHSRVFRPSESDSGFIAVFKARYGIALKHRAWGNVPLIAHRVHVWHYSPVSLPPRGNELVEQTGISVVSERLANAFPG